jgi:hypothetical protein
MIYNLGQSCLENLFTLRRRGNREECFSAFSFSLREIYLIQNGISLLKIITPYNLINNYKNILSGLLSNPAE